MKCDVCPTDDGEGIHYHAFIDGAHKWVCEPCKRRLNLTDDHEDDDVRGMKKMALRHPIT
jgi:hypothetical protein